jgi:hypothetical protein
MFRSKKAWENGRGELGDLEDSERETGLMAEFVPRDRSISAG